MQTIIHELQLLEQQIKVLRTQHQEKSRELYYAMAYPEFYQLGKALNFSIGDFSAFTDQSIADLPRKRQEGGITALLRQYTEQLLSIFGWSSQDYQVYTSNKLEILVRSEPDQQFNRILPFFGEGFFVPYFKVYGQPKHIVCPTSVISHISLQVYQDRMLTLEQMIRLHRHMGKLPTTESALTRAKRIEE